MTENPSFSHPLYEQGVSSRFLPPCLLVIFGATGDLTARKLMPALYNLMREGQLPTQFACIGFARRQKSHELFRQEVYTSLNSFSRIKIEDNTWENFREHIFYHTAEFHEEEGYRSLQSFLKELDVRFGTRGNRIFYLSTPPSFFTLICENLHRTGMIYDIHQVKDRWSRVIVEKPFGHDLDSAILLQKDLTRFLSEKQIFRIDHYLGKETVQNILVFRFANSIFESLWNNRYIDHFQITVAEDIGIGRRGAFFEEAGLLRDILQNHMMQLLCLMAMEPPVNLSADAIRDEKVKVLQAIRPIDREKGAIRGQYGSGYISGEEICAYQKEANVNPISTVETFVALRLFIDNWRWDAVPFYLRAGKRLPKRATEIAIIFKDPPAVLFQEKKKQNQPNVLVIRIQPDEGISLRMNTKVPGPSSPIQPVKMDFRYESFFGISPPDAYERLLLDCIAGDTTLFAREDEVFCSWKLLTPLLNFWKENAPTDFPNYPAGSWGPKSAEELLWQDHRKWRFV
jgi:glucose-6-phosphate 1-dehydrogenase